ncbi:ATP-dependent RNA helicase HrpA [Desulfococcaceae bacterium HSG8]|nr:ATP-dependent RNA helicase HrpA [Desulfococcaceae bacterium HSG8]
MEAVIRTKSPGNPISLRKIESILPKALGADRYLLKREIIRIRRSDKKYLRSPGMKKKLSHLEKRIRDSIRKKTERKENLRAILDKIGNYGAALPITVKKDEIIRAISKNRVVIISGETGSGKTTQIPKFCLAAGRGTDGKIGCTQPRRIAATTVANRIAEELGEEIGQSAGYKIRFADRLSENTYIKIMTDGILLAEAQGDPYLNEYDTIIVDEAHERSLNIDFVLGILKKLLRKRKDLKLVITSATIDTEKFSKAFDNAPIIKVSGRMYPVEVRYSPSGDDEQSYTETAVNTVYGLCRERGRGDILVFMPTEQDIRETCEMLDGKFKENKTGPDANILPLYARLSGAEQSKVFSNIPGRKVIVSTNVAETSVTIPGIRYVVDTGFARISQYQPGSRTTALPIVPISKSSADQRKGRCGRMENGVCVRLFPEEDFDARQLFTPPEILRSNLAEVILRMIALNLGDISDFPFIDMPALKNIKDGFDLLLELGAILPKENIPSRKKSESRFILTEKGRLMAKMPIDPRLSRMLIEAKEEGCLGEMTVIASALSIQDPRERPVEKQEEADKAHEIFKDSASDFISLLNIWEQYHTIKGAGKLKKFCKAHFLSFRRMREWRDIHSQIRSVLKENFGLKENLVQQNSSPPFLKGAGGIFVAEKGKNPPPFKKGGGNLQAAVLGSPEFETRDTDADLRYAGIHKSVLSGFLSNIAIKKEKNIFQAAKNREMMIFPGSGLFDKAGQWVVAAEMVETSRLFARTVAKVDVSWLEKLGKNQCKYTWSHPHWERKRGEVVASEQVSLYGLIIVPDRTVPYGEIDPDEATRVFIRSALVEGDMKRPFPFMEHNRKLTDEVRDMENRLRKRDILISDEDMCQFYSERIEDIYDIRTLQSCLKKRRGDRFLRMKKENLFLCAPDDNALALFPESVTLGNHRLDCSYNFDPGKHDDGVTVRVSSDIAASVPSESLDWIVPGLLAEKVTALIKGLPKSYRKKLVPVADTVDVIVSEMPQVKSEIRNSRLPNASLITALGNFVYKRFGLDIPASAWPLNSLPEHLKMRIAITDMKGKELRSGRDKKILRQNTPDQTGPDMFETLRKRWEKTGIISWDFDDLPDTMTFENEISKHRPPASDLRFYPGLEADDACVNLRLFRQQGEAVASHKRGIEKLYTLHLSKELKFFKKALALPKETKDQAKYFGGREAVEKKLYDSIIQDLFCKNIRKKDAFYAHAESVKPVIHSQGKKKSDSVMRVMKAYHLLRSALYDLEKANLVNHAVIRFLHERRDDLSGLVPETFMGLYGTDRMIHLERYIKAILIRTQRGVISLEKDSLKAGEVRIYNNRLNELVKELSPHVSEDKRKAVEEYFWILEEYKVSLFAQELKTAFPVSQKRLDKKLGEIERMA